MPSSAGGVSSSVNASGRSNGESLAAGHSGPVPLKPPSNKPASTGAMLFMPHQVGCFFTFFIHLEANIVYDYDLAKRTSLHVST